jgi:outer membrane protein W
MGGRFGRPAVLLTACAALAWPALGRAEPAGAEPAATDPAADELAIDTRTPAAPAPARHHRFYVRAGGALVKPLSSSRRTELADVAGPASLAVHNGPIAGSGATIGSAMIVAGTLGYVLTDDRRWSLELVLGLPFTVKFQATGTLANTSIAPTALGLETGVGPLGPQLGEAKAAPLVVTTVYQLMPPSAWFRPYVGAGASVLFALDAHVTNPTLLAVNRPEMTIAPAPGLVAQAGIEARLWRSLYARIDAKFIALMLARAEVHHVEVNTPGLPLFGNVEVGTAKQSLWVNPLIIQAGVGIDFDL